MKASIAVATMVLALSASGLCPARQPQPTTPTKSRIVVSIERIRDINLTEAQEAEIAGIQDEYAPKIEDAIADLKTVVREEIDMARVILTPEQLAKLENMKDERKAMRVEGLSSRLAHLRDLDLTDDEMTKIVEIRKDYRARIANALEGLQGILSPEQAKLREDALKAGKSRREVLASLNLNEEQKSKVDAVGKQVRALVKEEVEKLRAILNPELKENVDAMKADRREYVRDRVAFAIVNYKELNLTGQQKTKLETIRAEYRPRVQQAGNQLRALVREELAAIVAVLKT